VLLDADDQRIDGEARLDSFLASRSAGAAVTLVFAREGARLSTTATLSERPARVWEPDGKQVHDDKSGLGLQTLTAKLAVALGLDPDTQGALVTDLGSRLPEALARRIAVDDVVIRVDGRPVASAEQTVAALEALSPDRWDAVEVIRPGHVR
jgi:S1-C subfamily serine protease